MSVEVRVAISISLLSVDAALIKIRLNSATNFFANVAKSLFVCISSDRRVNCFLSKTLVKWRENIPLLPDLYLVHSS